MVETTYTCDKCNHSQKTDKQMWMIGVVINHVNQHHWPTNPSKSALWCRKCIESVGLLVPSEPSQINYKAVTIEDLVREIVKEEINNA